MRTSWCRIDPTDFEQIAGCRYGFMIADMVLGDTLKDFADGRIDHEEMDLALSQHRMAYEGYLRRIAESLQPVAEA